MEEQMLCQSGFDHMLTLWLSLYALGCASIFTTSFSQAVDAGAALPGFTVGLLFVGLGIAGVKSTVTTYIGRPNFREVPHVSSCVYLCGI